MSPDFLFLSQDPGVRFTPEQRISIGNAWRLSYFLWASMPDQELLELAQQGKLVSTAQLRGQSERMLLDPKIKSLATDFGMQWLKVNRLTSSQPDFDKFRHFYKRPEQPISIAMMVEQLLFFETVLVEDLSIMQFIHSDFAYLNRDLLQWYGLAPNHYVGFTPPETNREDFFRINYSKNHLRGGVITAGSTLVLTSTSLRTSPVFRGAWIAETIFNRPPPPPPPDVPALEDTHKKTGEVLSVRERLALHREDSNCYSCHARIDPLGFALEQFDAVGRIRQEYENGDPVDASGQLDGQSFHDAFAFKQTLLSGKKKEQFTRAFVEHMLRYAVNRKLVLADSESVDKIMKAVRKDDYRFHSIVTNIVSSDAFRSPPLSD